MSAEVVGLREILVDMRRIDDDSRYYALTLVASADGHIETITQTEFVEFASKPMWDYRRASRVHAHDMADSWAATGEPWVVVNSDAALTMFVRIGGNALIGESIFSEHFGRLLEPKECVPSRFGEQVRSLDKVGLAFLRRAPSKKMRMDVLRRDNFRCRACNRTPDDYVDIELHVHHVRPWGQGGLTEMTNLLTLCSTCHQGLDPHFEFMLLTKIPDGVSVPIDVDARRREFRAGVERYREHMEGLVEQMSRQLATTGSIALHELD